MDRRFGVRSVEERRRTGGQMRVVSVNVGEPEDAVYDGKSYVTAINRRSVPHRVLLGPTNLTGDRVGDTGCHGGPDKAACFYAHEYYAHWQTRLEHDLPVPSFGENLTTEGLLDDEVCLGDVLRIGAATVQISQPRNPCWKLAAKHGRPELPKWITEAGRTGFHVRVLETGDVGADDTIALIDRTNPGLTIATAIQALFGDSPSVELLARLAAEPVIAPAWRNRVHEKLARQSR